MGGQLRIFVNRAEGVTPMIVEYQAQYKWRNEWRNSGAIFNNLAEAEAHIEYFVSHASEKQWRIVCRQVGEWRPVPFI
jgi:hypothetical protein